jgi:hypothetical protein
MMKPLKIGLRVWIAMTSLLSFLGGWAILSHSGKPAPLFSTSGASVAAAAAATSNGAIAPDPSTTLALPTLQPLPSLNDLASSGTSVQALPALPNLAANNTTSNFTPRLRTRGS